MNRRFLLTRLSLWWLNNYEDCVHFWPPFMFCSVICAIIVGTIKHVPFTTLCIGIFIVGIIMNAGIYFILRTMESHLRSLPEGTDREEAHKEMINIILRRIKRGH